MWLLGDFLGGEDDAIASVLALQRPGLPAPLQAPLPLGVLSHRECEPGGAATMPFFVSHRP